MVLNLGFMGTEGAMMPDVVGIYFNFRSGDLASTSSQM